MTEVKRKRGRPSKVEVASREAAENRPTRERLSGPRDVLTVRGKDPNYFYYWVEDVSEDGNNVFRFTKAGYSLCSANENLSLSRNTNYVSQAFGSIYRVPASKYGNTYLYLMRKPMEWYLEDQKAEQDEVSALEKQNSQPNRAEGEYGEITHKTKFHSPDDLDD